MDSKQTAGHNCSRLFYTEASAWLLPQLVNVTAIKQPLVFLFLNTVVATVVLRGKIQIFKHTESTYQHIRAEKKAQYHCLPALPFLTIHLLFSISVTLGSASLPFSLHISCPSFWMVRAKPKKHSLEAPAEYSEVAVNARLFPNTRDSLELQHGQEEKLGVHKQA